MKGPYVLHTHIKGIERMLPFTARRPPLLNQENNEEPLCQSVVDEEGPNRQTVALLRECSAGGQSSLKLHLFREITLLTYSISAQPYGLRSSSGG